MNNVTKHQGFSLLQQEFIKPANPFEQYSGPDSQYLKHIHHNAAGIVFKILREIYNAKETSTAFYPKNENHLCLKFTLPEFSNNCELALNDQDALAAFIQDVKQIISITDNMHFFHGDPDASEIPLMAFDIDTSINVFYQLIREQGANMNIIDDVNYLSTHVRHWQNKALPQFNH